MPDKESAPSVAGGPLGIFGGTFDPVHVAHLRLADEARMRLGLVQVRWIPTGTPSHRGAPTASTTHRLAMLRLGIAGNPEFVVDDGEALSTSPSYTVPTLERVRAEVGTLRPLVLLLGADAFLGLAQWHRWRELFGLAHLAVATRPGYALGAQSMEPALAEEYRYRENSSPAAIADSPAGCIIPFGITALDISATTLRAEIAAGRRPRYLLPDPVLDYIAANQLYQPPPK